MNARGFIFNEHSTYIELSVGSFHVWSFREKKKVVKDLINYLLLFLYTYHVMNVYYLIIISKAVDISLFVNLNCL